MNSDLITVIVPVYNTEKYLISCVNSILSQSYQNMEIILVEDGATDGSPLLCDELASRNDKVRVIHKTNGGLSSARNAGLDDAKGEYVCFIDSDDYVTKDYISTLYELITVHNTDLAKIDYAEVTSDEYFEKSVNSHPKLYRNGEVEKAYLELKVDSACVFMYRRELIGSTRFIVGKTSEDIPFNFEIFRKAKSFVYLPVKKYCYYYNQGSISNGPLKKHMMNYLYFREEIYQYYLKQNDSYLVNDAEVLYARAAMGLLSRMALFGISDDLDEKTQHKQLRKILLDHKKSFFSSRMIPISRKLLGFAGLYAYGLLKMIGRIKK